MYHIKVYIPIEPDEPDLYPDIEDAINDLNQLKEIQPENHYEIVDEHGRRLTPFN